jgi:hypothetical protein
MARADVDYEGVNKVRGRGCRETYNLAAQSLVELVEFALHGRDIRMLERQSFRLQRV